MNDFSKRPHKIGLRSGAGDDSGPAVAAAPRRVFHAFFLSSPDSASPETARPLLAGAVRTEPGVPGPGVAAPTGSRRLAPSPEFAMAARPPRSSSRK